jgi:hypothetical protein
MGAWRPPFVDESDGLSEPYLHLSLNPSLRDRREGPQALDRPEEALPPGPAGR